jgi:uncharacterized protein YjiS (DUF1127 family)
MTHIHLTATTRHATPTLATRAASIARSAWHTYWDWRARRATVEILRSLDSRTLHDIGLSRGEIESVVHGRRGDRRHCYDTSWQWRAGA